MGEKLTEAQRAAKRRKPKHDETQDAAKRAAKALYLVRPRGQRASPLSPRNVDIYNYVQERIGKGYSALKARSKAAGRFATESHPLSEDGIEKICNKVAKAIRRK